MAHMVCDTARQAGVRIVTVSKVFNESTKVSPATGEKVLRIAREVGCQPPDDKSSALIQKYYIPDLVLRSTAGDILTRKEQPQTI